MTRLRLRCVRFLFGMLLLAGLVACASVPKNSIAPVQSPNDDYAYRLVTLDNGLRALLISDPDAPKAAASLTVMVGSGDNPPGRGGLAHFLEHMLFLGTDKYPDAAEYEQYITEHGGTRNAYTSFDHTNYFFDINAEFLPEALDRFAQFFIAPRFDAEYVEREKNAVQAEYQMGLKSDGRRGLDVLQEVMNPEHPYSQFAVGSLDTLADRPGAPIRDDLLSFYEQYYSANLMRLVVLGAQSLDELEALVAPMFSTVPNKAAEQAVIEAPLFEPESLPMLVQVQPLATLRQLEVSFPLADYRAHYRVNPVVYFGNLVGHEGEGSLLSQLKQEGLAEGLSAGGSLAWRGGSLFSVSVSLTEKGVEHRDRVLQLLFAYLDMLRSNGPEQWLYAEQASLGELSFRFREQGTAVRYVTGLSSGMHHYDPVDILRGPYMMEDYDARMLDEVLQGLHPDNAVVVFNDASVQTSKQSEHYEVPYSVAPLDRTAVDLQAAQDTVPAFALPAPNEFIAEDVALVPLPRILPDKPERVYTGPRKAVWYMPDDEFRVPKGAIYINFRSPEVGATARQAAMASLYTSVLMDDVNEFSYPARLAGLNFSFYKHQEGLSLRIRGYNDKQTLLLERLLNVVQASEFDPQRFENIRKDMIRSLSNSAAKRPSSQVMDDLREAVWWGQWGEQALIAELEAATPADMQRFIDNFWSNATAEVLVYGNYKETTGERVATMLRRIIPSEGEPLLPRMRVLALAPGEFAQYQVNLQHDDSVLAWYLQGAGDTWHDKAATALSAQIMKSGFFQQLRTEQQLGYVVSAFNWPQNDVAGLVMLIQSPVADAQALAQAMETFMGSVLADLDDEQFARHKAALRNEVLRPHKNQAERAEFYWQSLARKRVEFDGRERFAQALDALSMEQWKAYYTQEFLQQRRSLQVVAPGRWGLFPEGERTIFTSAEDVKAGHPAYQLP